MIKKYNSFIKESIANKGKGPGNDDLFLNAPKKQTINQSNQTADFLRLGKHIKTSNIDGFIDSVQNESIYISDRLTGEIKRYSLKEVLKGIGKYKEEKSPSTVQGFEGTPAWAVKQKIYESIEEDDDEFPEDENSEEEIDLDDNGAEIEFDDIDLDDDDDDEDFINIDDPYDPTEGENGINGNNPYEPNPLLYGTEDNPEGLPNKGVGEEISNEAWSKYWESYNRNIKLIKEDSETEEEEEYEENEYEVPIMRGTEDNPIPSRRKRKTKIESRD